MGILVFSLCQLRVPIKLLFYAASRPVAFFLFHFAQASSSYFGTVYALSAAVGSWWLVGFSLQLSLVRFVFLACVLSVAGARC